MRSALIICLALAVPSVVAARKGMGMVDKLVAIGVDPAVIAELKDEILDSQERNIDLHAQVQKERLSLRRLMDEDAPKERDVLAQVESVGAAEIALRKNQISLMLKVRAVLTPEQRIQIEAKSKRSRRDGRREQTEPR
ncbi:MAG: periplasmic heavy metal sensor [Myxococcota bacterium]